MKKHILIILLSIITLSAYAQPGSLSQSVYRSRVNDSTTVNGAHASGYADFFWNNQATTPGWRVWNGTTYDIGFSAGGNFWKNAGTTTLTGNVLIDGGTNDIFIDTDGDWRFGNSNSAIYTDIGANQMLWYSNAFSFLISGTLIDIQSPGNGAGVVVSANDVAIGATDDVNISAGPTGSAHDVNISSAAGHIHLQTGAAGILLDPAGPITINTDPGTAGYYLQSNGAGAAPTWVAPTGGGLSATNFVFHETPTGLVNSSNVTYTLANTPTAGTVQVFLNGLLQVVTTDYSISGTTITFVTAPTTGDFLRTHYMK